MNLKEAKSFVQKSYPEWIFYDEPNPAVSRDGYTLMVGTFVKITAKDILRMIFIEKRSIGVEALSIDQLLEQINSNPQPCKQSQ